MSDFGIYEVLDPRFIPCMLGDKNWERVYADARWTEGPVYVPAGRYLLFSDIPNNRMMRWDEPTGTTGVFRAPSHYANGNTIDAQGRIVTCEQGSRSVTRTEHDGSITTIADSYQGKRLNSPNDVVVAEDGAVWFTDPSYGIDSDYEGHRAESEIGACLVFRAAPDGELRMVADDFIRPNGLAFSLDGSELYIVDTGNNHIRKFDVGPEGKLAGGDWFATSTNGWFDGIRLDDAGRVWCAGGDGVHCYDPDGTLLGKITLPEAVSNLTFGGPKRNELFACATTSIYRLMTSVRGAALG
jgi:gluconolactonase